MPLNALRQLVYEALLQVQEGSRKQPSKTSFERWSKKVISLYQQIEEQKRQLSHIGISIPPMKECVNLIDFGLCVATKERGFEVLLIAREVEPEALVQKELGGDVEERNIVRKRPAPQETCGNVYYCSPPQLKRQKTEEEEDESKSSSDSSFDEPLQDLTPIPRENVPCDRCRIRDIPCYLMPFRSTNGTISLSVNCSRCRVQKKSCRTDNSRVDWELRDGQYIGFVIKNAREGTRRLQKYIVKAPLVHRQKSRLDPSEQLMPATASNDPPKSKSQAKVVSCEDAFLAQPQASSSQNQLPVKASSFQISIPTPLEAPAIVRRHSTYPLTPPLETRNVSVREMPRTNVFSHSTPSSANAGPSHHDCTSDPAASSTNDAIAQVPEVLKVLLLEIEKCIARAKDETRFITDLSLFARNTASSNIESQFIRLDLNGGLEDILSRLEQALNKYDRSYTTFLAINSVKNGGPYASKRADSPRRATSPGDSKAVNIFKAMDNKLQALRVKARAAIEYKKLLGIGEHRERAFALCEHAIENVKVVTRDFRGLCIELKESVEGGAGSARGRWD